VVKRLNAGATLREVILDVRANARIYSLAALAAALTTIGFRSCLHV